MKHRVRDFLGFRHALERMQAFDERQHVGAGAGCVGDARRGIGPAGENGIHPYRLRSEFGRQRLGEADQSRLAGGIGDHAGHANRVAHERRSENQRAAAPREQRRHLVFGTEKSAAEIGIERIAPGVEGQLQQAGVANRAGIVERDIEPTKPNSHSIAT